MIHEPISDEQRWAAVAVRDASQNGHFVFGVKTTGVYCRPGCGARLPKRQNVVFFDVPAAAEQAGFRACRRCHPERQDLIDPMMAAVEDAARRIDRSLERDQAVPGLEALAAAAGFNAQHFQKSFRKALGLSPREYADARRLARLKAGLRDGHGVADAVYGAGYGSSSRVYERADAELGMSPGTYAKGAPGVVIRYATAPCRLGLILAAQTAKGVAAVTLGDDADKLARELELEYPGAVLTEDSEALAGTLAQLLDYLEHDGPRPDLPLDVRATAFQWRVWQALKQIPYGETRTYGEVAAMLGKPTASRAVGRACGLNPVSLTIPCHRVVGASGKLTGYRWGPERKEALLDMEAGNRKTASGRGD